MQFTSVLAALLLATSNIVAASPIKTSDLVQRDAGATTFAKRVSFADEHCGSKSKPSSQFEDEHESPLLIM
jgi:hypothetical protein